MGERSGIGCLVQRRLPMADLESTVIAASRHVDVQATRRCAVAPLVPAMIGCSRATARLLRAPRTAKDLGAVKLEKRLLLARERSHLWRAVRIHAQLDQARLVSDLG